MFFKYEDFCVSCKWIQKHLVKLTIDIVMAVEQQVTTKKDIKSLILNGYT